MKSRVLLVPSLKLERWKAMDRYAAALARDLPAAVSPDVHVTLLSDPGYPTWTRFAARWLAYPRTIDWSQWDLVHVLDHSYAHMLHKRKTGVRTVLTVHDLFAFDPLSQKRGLRGLALQRINGWVLDAIHDADVCLCDSEATRSALVARFPELQSRAAHQTLGVDDRFFVDDLQAARTAGRRALGLDAGEWVVLNVGSCVDRKRIPNVLTAFAQFAREMPRARLVQVGGRFTADQRRHAEALAIDQRVVQRPDVSEELMPSIYAAADVVVIGSAFEGFGLPVLEALAVGVPVVSTRNTALAEFPEEFVWSAGPGDGAALTAAMQSVFARPADAHTRAAAARAWARTRTWPDVARGVASIYHRLL